VHVCVAGPDGHELRALRLPGDRTAVRERSVTRDQHPEQVHRAGGPPA
jgi:hypothetical protein